MRHGTGGALDVPLRIPHSTFRVSVTPLALPNPESRIPNPFYLLCVEALLNVVFDLGGVLLTWDPSSIVSEFFDDPATRQLVLEQVFNQPDWLDLDRGTLDPAKAVDRWTERTGLPREEMARLMSRVPLALVPIEDSLALLPRLKQTGQHLYCLSNMHLASIHHLEHTYPFFDLFEGTVISARIHMVKPEPGIYRYLLDTCSLAPEETVFIDDMDYNCAAANKHGIRTIHFKSPDQCARNLEALGCL